LGIALPAISGTANQSVSSECRVKPEAKTENRTDAPRLQVSRVFHFDREKLTLEMSRKRDRSVGRSTNGGESAASLSGSSMAANRPVKSRDKRQNRNRQMIELKILNRFCFG